MVWWCGKKIGKMFGKPATGRIKLNILDVVI